MVKRNRAEPEAELRQLFALPPDPSYPVQAVRSVDYGHGRLTIRQLTASGELNLALANEWRTVLALLNAVILALFDRVKIDNARSAIRTFDARPHTALALLF